MEHTANQITLRGSLASLPQFSHENHGKRFCRFFLEVERLSGAVDTLPVVAREELLKALDLGPGIRLTARGQVRSHNHTDVSGRHLMVFVFASDLWAEDGEPVNEVTLTGLLCREPTFRRTPLGREICDAMLAVPRAFKRADYLPCIAWGTLARQCGDLNVGDAIALEGRLQSRTYTKRLGEEVQERTAFEISIMSMDLLCEPRYLREIRGKE